MLTKKYVKSRKIYKVTFEVPREELPKGVEIESVSLVGEFNEWDPEATPMKKMKSGSYKTTFEFEAEGVYQYRYCANGAHWFNDWEADGYAPNPHGVDNCVLQISGD